jgi:hypothetical protein
MYQMFNRFFGCVVFIICCNSITVLSSETYSSPIIPASGPLAVYQHALDAHSNLTVLSLALEPGAEDLSALTYFRLARGAKTVSAYITNGEGRESDTEYGYPSIIASIRRTEAASIMDMLDAESVFLNFPHLPAASDNEYVASKWNADTLQMRFMELISTRRPDIILLFRGILDAPEIVEKTVIAELGHALRYIGTPTVDEDFRGDIVLPRWDVERVLITSKIFSGRQLPVTTQHPVLGKSFAVIATGLGSAYGSIRQSRRTDLIPTYTLLYPTSGDYESHKPVPASLSRIHGLMQNLTRDVLQMPESALLHVDELIPRIAAVLDSIDSKFSSVQSLRGHERRLLLQWKGAVESLRTTLLGVELYFSVSELILTNRQLTYLSIDSVRGIENLENAELYFPFVDDGWFVNESSGKRFPLTLDEDYRLVTPQTVSYTYPYYPNGLDKPSISENIYFFLIYRGETRERSFIYRNTVRIHFAPRFVAEVLTPIICGFGRDPVVFQLTNNTRDGVTDQVYISGNAGTSERKRFRLPSKGSVYRDTLYINWSVDLTSGDHVLPLIVGRDTLTYLAARKFTVIADTAKRVGIVGALPGSPIPQSLTRLGIQGVHINPTETTDEILNGYDVIILDRKGLNQTNSALPETLKRYAASGGRVLVLPQDADVWNRTPLIDALELRTDLTLDESTSVATDSVGWLLEFPNKVQTVWWESWIYRRAHNKIILGTGSTYDTPVIHPYSGDPYIVSATIGKGKIIYCDLSLSEQLLNIHSGALSLLANLISSRTDR